MSSAVRMNQPPGVLPVMPEGDIKFALPELLEAREPPEARGIGRDGVRLMVSYRSDDRVVHARFTDLVQFLNQGDVLVINTSGTLNAAVKATRRDGTQLELHLSTHVADSVWTVELRLPTAKGTVPFLGVRAGETFTLPEDASAAILSPYRSNSRRIWNARLETPYDLKQYLVRNGSPVRYGYVREPWDVSYYQTVYATEDGSAEMPSAGRPFTAQLITQLVAHGVLIVPILLHTGVASLESHEAPYEEYYRVSSETARVVNAARAERNRVIAVGTTVVRALESATDMEGVTWPHSEWTDLVVSPTRGVRAVDGLLTGLHEPNSTHLAMLEALAGRDHIQICYASALENGYLWHEFGDVHLILP